MAKLPNKVIALLLALTLVAPANAGLSSWMAMSMADQELDHASQHSHRSHQPHPIAEGISHSQHLDHTIHAHSSHAGTSEQLSGDGQTSHSDEDCNEHCVSCANHCSNMGLLSDPISLPDVSKTQHGSESGTLSKHTDLLYRPPIRH